MLELHISLRPPSLDDVVPYAGFLADPEVSVWLDDTAQRPLSPARVQSILLNEAWCLWAIDVEGAFVGVCSLYEPNLVCGTARLSIVVGDRQYWGKGIGTVAVRHAAAHGFQALGLRKIHSDYLEPNTAAHALHVRVGFTVEGRLRQDAWRQGRWVDRIVASLLRDEFDARDAVLPHRAVR